MEPPEQARLLLDKASPRLSGGELDLCERVAGGDHLLSAEERNYLELLEVGPDPLDGWREESDRSDFTRLTTEFAHLLK